MNNEVLAAVDPGAFDESITILNAAKKQLVGY
jgi:hypothetical protein